MTPLEDPVILVVPMRPEALLTSEQQEEFSRQQIVLLRKCVLPEVQSRYNNALVYGWHKFNGVN